MNPNLVIKGFAPVLPVGGSGQSAKTFSKESSKNISFESVLLQKSAETHGIKFSKHALERIERRGIRISSEDITRIARGIEQVRVRGGNESLLLMGDLAFVVSASNRTVVTAMEKGGTDPTVVTHIDSAVML